MPRVWKTQAEMAKRPTTPKELPNVARETGDRLREAVESTMQATAGSAGKTRSRAQGAVDELVETVDDIVRGAGARVTRSRDAVRDALDPRLPATQDDVRELKAELRAIGRRLEAIEERLPKKSGRSSSGGGAKRPPTKRTQAKRSQG